jgi:hypothetical protein
VNHYLFREREKPSAETYGVSVLDASVHYIKYGAFILWKGINYRKPHFMCVEDGVRELSPPFDGKIMGFKRN